MKQKTRIVFVLTLCAALVAPAWAVDFEFKGEWLTRAYMMQNFTGEDRTEARDGQLVDTYTLLELNAAVNDNLKFYNQFEFYAIWRDDANYGAIWTDGTVIKIRHTYADFTKDAVNVKVGAQPTTLARGFLLDCDFAGLALTYAADSMDVPFTWVKHTEGGLGKDANDGDVDYYIIAPVMTMGDMSVSPYLMSVRSKEHDFDSGMDIDDFALFYLGVDVDARMDVLSAWATAIYQAGSFSPKGGSDVDIKGWLVALGGEFGMSDLLSIRGQVFAASGQDDSNDVTAFQSPDGASYYWAEIMGLGFFDDFETFEASNGSPADRISDIMAANIGATVNPMDKLTVRFDLWYAQLMEEDMNGNKNLGTEINIVVSYQLMENLNLDVVAAYLIAGDATTLESSDKANPIELGFQLALEF